MLLAGSLSKQDDDGKRESEQTKGLMSETIAFQHFFAVLCKTRMRGLTNAANDDAG